MNCSENQKFYIDIFLEGLKVDKRILSFDYMIEKLLKVDLSDDQLLMAISVYKGLYESLLHIDRMSHNKPTIDMVSRTINSVDESVKLLEKQPTQSIYAKNIVNKIREHFNYKPKDSIRTQIDAITEKFKNEVSFEVLFMTYSYVHRMINAEAFPNAIDLYDKNKMTGRGRGKYCYNPIAKDEGEELIRAEIAQHFPENKILYVV